jgi:hypothetical protein
VIAARKLRETGFLHPGDLTVIFATGSGLMHTDLIDVAGDAIDPNAPDLVTAIGSRLTTEDGK